MKKSIRRLAVAFLRRVQPKFPAWLWDAYVTFKVGAATGEEIALYVPWRSGEAITLPLGELPQRSADAVRFVIVSDTHERHRCLTLPAGDVFLHCGDILMSSSLSTRSRGMRVLADFNQWLATVPCEEKVVIGGNHDAALSAMTLEQAQSVLSNSTYLQESSVDLPLAGLRVYGTGHSTGASHNMAWQHCELRVDDAARGAHVVLLHGCDAQAEEVLTGEISPLIVASGHYHVGHGAVWRSGSLFVNAAIMDRRYQPLQPPVVVDLPRSALAPRACAVQLL
mmetsp:Transcript_8578/g.22155  ORF Transcript_8578/g.22155 Transcript_8578/m.22155 type:complete len:281 (-) Transcript_8578:104-946(-)